MTETPEIEPTPKPSKEVRQNRIQGHWQFDTIAVAQDLEITPNTKWGCMNPDNGGHWATTADVEGWTVLN